MSAGTGRGPDRSPRDRAPLLEILTVAGPVGLLTGLTYYVGYVSSRTFYAHFGVGMSHADHSTAGNSAVSADTLFRPAATALLVMIVALVVHHMLGRLLTRGGPRWSRFAARGVGGAGAVLAVVGLGGLYGTISGTVAALCLAGAAGLIEYALRLQPRGGRSRRTGDHVDVETNVRLALVVAVVMMAVFWVVTDLAVQRGRAAAGLFERSLPLQAQAVVYSDKDLQLSGPGVRTVPILRASTAYGFRYNGLRQLLHANGRWFLLPVGWNRADGATVVVLPDDHGGSRVDLAP